MNDLEMEGPSAMNQDPEAMESVDEPRISPRPTWNTSGQGKEASVPMEIDGRWNWCAFLFPPSSPGSSGCGCGCSSPLLRWS
jgi:hypothetical protein